ncbi:tyrosine-type recombinase/integrase [Exiguobacterium antarcticum]|uniref:tyrosine-type recombinase/integrase n=1 Tax=Exiguobacterium antarcticum TaxID=132920 RepID=UPI0004787E85|nr:site-specific integrase [Exiguobacterium antarcticum]
MHYTIKKLDNGKYWTRLSLTDRDGNRHQPSKTKDTQRELKRWATDMIRKNEDGALGKKTGKTVQEVADEYLQAQVGILKERTIYHRHYALDIFNKTFGKRVFDTLTRRELTAWADRTGRERGLKTSSRNSLSRHINSMFTYAYENRYILDKEARIQMRREQVEREKTLWTVEHIQRFEAIHKDDPTAKMYIIVAHTGMRSNEIRSLGWEHVDFKNGLIHIERQAAQSMTAGRKNWTTLKSGRGRVIPMSQHLRKMLERWRFEQRAWLHEHGAENVQDLVVTREDGCYIYDCRVMRPFHEKAAQAGLPSITLHTLRHTYATLLIQQGLPLTGIQNLLGHGSLTTTVKYYLHVTDEIKDRARVILDDLYSDKNA